jgi:rare lipoprotein A
VNGRFVDVRNPPSRRVAALLAGIAASALSACSTLPESAQTGPARNEPMREAESNPQQRSVAPVPAAPAASAPSARPRAAVSARPTPQAERSPDPDAVPEPTPKAEPIPSWGNRPYVLFGQRYQPMTEVRPFRERGLASWYGKPFHGRKTAIGERFDMYRMMAAHPTLPLPSYARVTNLRNGRTVIVRVNDRGPYKYGRQIDLSFAAAHRLGFTGAGTTEVDIELIVPQTAAVPTGGPAPGTRLTHTASALH